MCISYLLLSEKIIYLHASCSYDELFVAPLTATGTTTATTSTKHVCKKIYFIVFGFCVQFYYYYYYYFLFFFHSFCNK